MMACDKRLNCLQVIGQIDDSLDVFAVHGVGGILGSILMPLAFTEALGGTGFAAGMDLSTQLTGQAIGVGVVALWTAVVTLVLARAVALVLPMRVDEEAEHEGLDLHSHGERGWNSTKLLKRAARDPVARQPLNRL